VMRALGVEQREQLLEILLRLKEDPASDPPVAPRVPFTFENKASGKDFFHGMAVQLTQALQKEFDFRMETEIDRIRLAYAEAMQKEKDSFLEQLWQLTKFVKSEVEEVEAVTLPENAVELSEEQLQSFKEAAQLKVQVAELLSQHRSSLDQTSVQYCKATALVLKDLVRLSKTLQDYCDQRLASLAFDFSPKNLAGVTFPLPNVHPAVDTVKHVKQQLRSEHGCQSCVVKLCMAKELVMEMKDPHLLMDYDLNQEVTLVLVDSLVANPLVRLSFEDPSHLVFESVSGTAGTVEYPEDVQYVNSGGRTGVNIVNRGCLILPKTVQLGEEWTISVWTLAPIDVGDHTYRDLVDAPNSQELIAVIMARGKLGNYNSNSFIEGFNARDLTPGWHHIAVVASGRCTTYYVDGQSLGMKRGRARGTIGVVGNSRGCREAWGYMSDFQIFGVAADAQQIRGLYDAGDRACPALVEGEEPWQASIARQNAEFSDSLSEFSHSSSDF